MKRPVLTLPLKPKTIAQQNTDFTAEGSPPPGKVGTEAPVDIAKETRVEHDKANEAEAVAR